METNNSAVNVSTGLSDKDFLRLSHFIESQLGIKMPEAKRIMLESRLQKRIRLYKLSTFSEYVDYVFSDEGTRTELLHMIDAVTTNKTDFFRESDHFDYLLNTLLPEFMKNELVSSFHPLHIWSAGCSTGEEPYTLAMVIEEFKNKRYDFDYSILASDLSTQVLEKAQTAIYDEEKADPIPLEYKKKYLLKSKNSDVKQVRIKPEIRAQLEFMRLNLMDTDFGIPAHFQIIFCRNVIIYFDRATQEKILKHLYDHLVRGGCLFLGHSETLTGMDINFKTLAPTIYQKP